MAYYRQNTQLEVVQVLSNGDYLVQVVGHPENQWVIQQSVWTSMYEAIPGT